jgi:YD repeat-containing protein
VNGNLLSDGTNTYTWDRANRLLGMGNTQYAYDGMGNRLSQTVNSVATRYLLDTQPGLALVLGETTNANATHYIHSPRGIHSVYNHWLYSAEPVVNAPGRIFQFLTFAYLPADCPRLCPDTIPLTCT